MSGRTEGMQVQLALICDAANQSQQGKLNMLGEFDVLLARSFPCTHPQMSYAAKVRWPMSIGPTVRFSLRVVDSDERVIAGPLHFEARNSSPKVKDSEYGMLMALPIVLATFPAAGTYYFVLSALDEEINRIPFHLMIDPRLAKGR
jgi:hypothetical protein